MNSLARHCHAFAWALLAGLIAVFMVGSPCRAEGIAIQSGQKLAFLGDSITSMGWDVPTGYVHLVIAGLDANDVKVTPIPAGVSGNKSNDMLNRLDNDVLKKKPDWLTISCGVNDVWHGASGVPLPQYKQNMTQIVNRAQAAGIKVMILTATMIGEDQPNGNNQKLIGYNVFLRQLAKEKHCLLADLNADMQTAIEKETAAGKKPAHLLTQDGVHMNPLGNMMMAAGILKAFGLDQDQLNKAREAWLNIPNGWTASVQYEIHGNENFTLGQYLELQKQTTPERPGVADLLEALFRKDAEAALVPANGQPGKTKEIDDKFHQDVNEMLKK
jgi:lysophospholipase L1-like esterase